VKESGAWIPARPAQAIRKERMKGRLPWYGRTGVKEGSGAFCPKHFRRAFRKIAVLVSAGLYGTCSVSGSRTE
jgi:hypothetical protein